MITIGIETSCDETAVGIVENGKKILANAVSTQVEEHKKYAGVVPEIASRLHLQKINFIYAEALKQAGIHLKDIDLISVVNRPGLVGSLMVGASFAKTLTLNSKKPLVTVNHLISHLYANFLSEDEPRFPYIGLLISGGHTMLLIASSHHDYRIVGTTLDDAVGESFDKIAKVSGLGYPGGPAIDRICRTSGEHIEFTPGLKKDKKNKYNFSYSGLKTAVYYYIKQNPNTSRKKIIKGFQIAAIEILVEKTRALSDETGINEIVVAGGVAANSYLRELFSREKGLRIHLPDIFLCTDNGAMAACAGYYKSRTGACTDSLDFEVYSKPKGGPSAYLNEKFSIH